MRALSGGCEATGVVRGGLFFVDDKRSLTRKIAALPDGPVILRIEPALGARTLEDNRRYWGVLQDVAEQTGNDIDTLHLYYKQKLNQGRSTTLLDERVFRHYVDQVMADAAIEHGVVFPYPEPLIGGIDAVPTDTPTPDDGRDAGLAAGHAEGVTEDRAESQTNEGDDSPI